MNLTIDLTSITNDESDRSSNELELYDSPRETCDEIDKKARDEFSSRSKDNVNLPQASSRKTTFLTRASPYGEKFNYISNFGKNDSDRNTVRNTMQRDQILIHPLNVSCRRIKTKIKRRIWFPFM